MPELVACPHCGCKVQMAEAALGQPARCFACGQRFTAQPAPSAPAAPLPTLRPKTVSEEQVPPRRPPPTPEDGRGGFPPVPSPGLARCPRCEWTVAWSARYCPKCGLEFDDDRDVAWTVAGARRDRRDCLPHRGEFLYKLSWLSLVTGILSLCLCGLGGVVSLPVGAVVLVLARHDLALMRQGEMEAGGRVQTEKAQANAVIGIILGLLFAALFGIGYLQRIL